MKKIEAFQVLKFILQSGAIQSICRKAKKNTFRKWRHDSLVWKKYLCSIWYCFRPVVHFVDWELLLPSFLLRHTFSWKKQHTLHKDVRFCSKNFKNFKWLFNYWASQNLNLQWFKFYARWNISFSLEMVAIFRGLLWLTQVWVKGLFWCHEQNSAVFIS